MLEFLIRRTDGEWFTIPNGGYAAIMHPLTIPWRPVEGWGSHRIEIEGEEISFSDEDPGFQVVFESGLLPRSRALEIVQDVCRNIEATIGEQTRIVEY